MSRVKKPPKSPEPGALQRLQQALRQAIEVVRTEIRERPWRVEIALGSLFLFYCLVGAPRRAAFQPWLKATYYGLSSLPELLRVDGEATRHLLGITLARLAIPLVAVIMLIFSLPRRRLLWVAPLLALLVMASSPLSLASLRTTDRWVILVGLSLLSTLLVRLRYMRWTVILPFLVLAEVVPSHNMGPRRTAKAISRQQILADCAQHDGKRPENLSADQVMPYHGVTLYNENYALLTGEGPNDGDMRGHAGDRRVGSWWMVRRGDHFDFELPATIHGNLWGGCTSGQIAWIAGANRLFGARLLRGSEPKQDEALSVDIPANDIDFGEVACDPESDQLFVGEGGQGGLWQVAPYFAPEESRGKLMPENVEPTRYAIGGVGLRPKWRYDGKVVVADSASMTIVDPKAHEIVDRVASGIASLGFDLCAVNGAAAVTDFTGRLRIFELDRDRNYRFAWGLTLFAPRRVAFSPDCTHIAVTSGDDRHVFLIDASKRTVVQQWRAGPALRELVASGPREFSITDVCSLTTLQW